jgi:hypothetical protein
LALVLVLLGVAAWFIWRHAAQSGFDAQQFLRTFQGLRWTWLASAGAATLATYYLRALRWAVFNETLSPAPDVWKLTKATAIGFAAITLLGRPGEFVRPYLIARAERLSVSSQIAALVLERVFDLLAAVLIFGFGLSLVQASAMRTGERFSSLLQTGGVIAFALAAASVAALILNKYYGDSFERLLLRGIEILPARLHNQVSGFARSFFEGLQSIRRGGAILRVLAYTAVEWALIVVTILCVFKAFEPQLFLSLLDVIILLGFLAFGAVVQVPGVGGGVQVVTILVLTEFFGVPLEVASSAAIVLWAVTFVVVVPVGLVLALVDGIEFSKLRKAKAEAI